MSGLYSPNVGDGLYAKQLSLLFQLDWLWEQLPVTERGDLDYRTFLKLFSLGDIDLGPTPTPASVPELSVSSVEVGSLPSRPRPRSGPCDSSRSKVWRWKHDHSVTEVLL